VYGAKQDIRKITADEMLAVYTVNTVGPLLVVQQLLEAGLIGGLGGKTLLANVTSKVLFLTAHTDVHEIDVLRMRSASNRQLSARNLQYKRRNCLCCFHWHVP
jgi:hypothetical protein